jgi:polyketide synthase PksJ
MIDRNYSFLVAMLGILKAGAAYVPVDPSFPPDRQVYIFNHSRCAFVILDEACYNSAISLGIDLPPYIKMDTDGNILEMTVPSLGGKVYGSEEIRRYRSIDSDERLAYVLYTSGSTGKPKGVMVKNVGVVNIINWYCSNLRITSSSRVMGLTTFCFDISVLEMWMALSRGGCLVLGKSASQKDPFTLLDVMKRHKVDVFQATPTTYEMMLATGWTGDKQIDFLVGGEACRPSVLPIALNCRSFRNVCKYPLTFCQRVVVVILTLCCALCNHFVFGCRRWSNGDNDLVHIVYGYGRVGEAATSSIASWKYSGSDRGSDRFGDQRDIVIHRE